MPRPLAALFTGATLACLLPAQVVVTANETPRRVSRVLFTSGFDRPAEVAIGYGPAVWRNGYGAEFHAKRAAHFRLGTGFWATLHANVSLQFGDKKEMPPSVWYLGLHRDADQKWFLTLMDAAKMHRTHQTSGSTRDLRWDALVPLDLSKGEAVVEQLSIKLAAEAKQGQPVTGTVRLAWGPHVATATFRPKIVAGNPAGEPAFQKLDPARTVVLKSGLRYQELAPGAGANPTLESKVVVHYVGWLADGKKFDSTFTRKQSATFPLKMVIRGWQEGIAKMKPGARFLIEIPPDLGYGARGTGPIPGDSTLIFWVELVGF